MKNPAENPIDLIVARFGNQEQAVEVLEELKHLKQERMVGLWNAAVITKDENGKLLFKETVQTVGIKRSLGICGILGAIIGILAGGPITGIVLGSASSTLTGKFIDLGFDEQELKEIGYSLGAGSSAIIAIIEHKWVRELVDTLTELEPKITCQRLKDEVAMAIAIDADFENLTVINR
ncbi:DUF1269 domain-containing protein [Pelatocladus sp. BLCC-F211]|uniref:DUF1269 domain-containing protein n=1 Tax=Pelatocladus sp. BLCC-F211 TaxID=3342752 RepID=UPI0035B72F19